MTKKEKTQIDEVNVKLQGINKGLAGLIVELGGIRNEIESTNSRISDSVLVYDNCLRQLNLVYKNIKAACIVTSVIAVMSIAVWVLF